MTKILQISRNTLDKVLKDKRGYITLYLKNNIIKAAGYSGGFTIAKCGRECYTTFKHLKGAAVENEFGQTFYLDNLGKSWILFRD